MHCLSEIANINQETYSPKSNWDYINYLDTSSITDGKISEVQYIQPSVDKLPSRARRILKQGDIVFSTVRPNQLHYGIVSNPLPNMLGSTGFAVIRSNASAIPNEILYLALTEPSFIEQMQQIAEQSVSTFPSIRPSDLDACNIPTPQEGEGEIMAAIQALFAESAANNEENIRLSLLRDTLLPKLVSGELDVSDLEL
ncbi:MAG: restriction endonuclease subunit S [Lachnospiraceae bacterium]|nr:restriction endonuclease subunit S [Lachnospiraceae bacterium]